MKIYVDYAYQMPAPRVATNLRKPNIYDVNVESFVWTVQMIFVIAKCAIHRLEKIEFIHDINMSGNLPREVYYTDFDRAYQAYWLNYYRMLYGVYEPRLDERQRNNTEPTIDKTKQD
jgi:hypothetical protein